MSSIITFEGIDEAIENLRYNNKRALKYKLINAIREQYRIRGDIAAVKEISTDFLVKSLWDTGDDPAIIRNRRKNFNSIKSTVNADLKKLYGEGKISEGIVINQKNIFDMSDEAKSEMLEAFSYAEGGDSQMHIGKITDVLNVINDFISNKESRVKDNEKFEQLKEIIKKISDKAGITIDASGNAPEGQYQYVAGEGGTEILSGGDGIKEELIDDLEVDDIEEVEVEDTEDEEFEEIPGEKDVDDLDGSTDEIEDVPEDEFEEIEAEDIEGDVTEEFTGEGDDSESGEAVYEIEEIPEDEIRKELSGEPEEDDYDGVDEFPEEELEEVPDDEIEEDDFEDLEIIDAVHDEEGSIQETEKSPGGKYDYALDEILDDYDVAGYPGEDGQKKALILADKFDKMLSETERYYNRYILIPGGKYTTGHAAPDGNEKRQSYIELVDFYMGKFPVTNHLFELFIEKTGYVTTAERKGYGIVYKGRYRNTLDQGSGRKTIEWSSSLESENVKGACWFMPNGPVSSLHGKRNHPVVQVTLEDAIAFAAWTGKKLPTEDEWEAASRTSKAFDYPWGKSLKEGLCNIEASTIGDTTPVDEYEKAANRFGLNDLLGNVLEWTGSKDLLSDESTCIARGGSWVSGEDIRLTKRFSLDARTSSNILGFRCIAYK